MPAHKKIGAPSCCLNPGLLGTIILLQSQTPEGVNYHHVNRDIR